MSVLLHIGFHKTGTTSIQTWLRDREEDGTLAERCVRFPRGWLRLNNHMELHMGLMRPDRMTGARSRGDEWRDPDFRAFLVQQVRDDLAAHPDELTVLSAEDTSFLWYANELEPLAELVGTNAHVVVYRRYPEVFLAAWRDQLSKRGTALSDDPKARAFNYVEPDSWLIRYPERISRFRSYFPLLTEVDYDRVVATDGTVIPSFAHLLGMPPIHADQYWLNVRGEFEARPEGNRFVDGSRFGEDHADRRADARTG